MKIIFLDFDGVLVTSSSQHKATSNSDVWDPTQWFDQELVRRFREALSNRSDEVQIVISSSWRLFLVTEGRTPEEFMDRIGIGREFLHPHWRTPQLNKARGHEVMAWLDAHADSVHDFICVDDDPDFFKSWFEDGHVLITKTEFGISPQKCDLVRDWILSGDREGIAKMTAAMIKDVDLEDFFIEHDLVYPKEESIPSQDKNTDTGM